MGQLAGLASRFGQGSCRRFAVQQVGGARLIFQSSALHSNFWKSYLKKIQGCVNFLGIWFILDLLKYIMTEIMLVLPRFEYFLLRVLGDAV